MIRDRRNTLSLEELNEELALITTGLSNFERILSCNPENPIIQNSIESRKFEISLLKDLAALKGMVYCCSCSLFYDESSLSIQTESRRERKEYEGRYGTRTGTPEPESYKKYEVFYCSKNHKIKEKKI